MSLTAGAITSSNITGTSDTVSVATATSGTTPYSYQWYRSTTTGFVPGTTTKLAGATGQTLNDSGLQLGVKYYYLNIVIDSAATPASATAAQVGVQLLQTPQSSPSQNAFAMAPYLGMTDLPFNGNSLEVKFDPAGSGSLAPSQAVKWSTAANGQPMVVPSTAAADVVAGFVNYDIKSQSYNPGDKLQISLAGNVMYLQALAGVNRGTVLTSTPSGVTNGGTGVVTAVTGNSGYPIVGYALDTTSAAGLIRVMLTINPAAYAVD